MQFLILIHWQQIPKKLVMCKDTYVHIHTYVMNFLFFFQSNLQTAKASPPCSLYHLPISSTLHSTTHPSLLSIGTPWPIEGTRVRPRRLRCPPSCKPHPSPSSCRTAGSLAVMYHWKAGNSGVWGTQPLGGATQSSCTEDAYSTKSQWAIFVAIENLN